MTVYFTPQFLDDLKSSDDARFIRRALAHACDSDGGFVQGQDDHRYDGVADGWIRYVTRGKTAYRLIYIRRDADVYLYRVGPHSVEDNLSPPRSLEGVPLAGGITERTTGFSAGSAAGILIDVKAAQGDLVKTSQPLMLSRLVHSMVHVKHREIIIVSPYYTAQMLNSKAPFGRFLDRAVEENTAISLITRSSDSIDLEFFASLEARGICVFFHPKLHAKMYLFDVITENLNSYTRDVKATAVIGSANLTDMGLALAGEGKGNEELCYRLPVEQFEEAKTHAYWLMRQSADFLKFKRQSMRK